MALRYTRGNRISWGAYLRLQQRMVVVHAIPTEGRDTHCGTPAVEGDLIRRSFITAAPNKRMQLPGASGLRNVGLCAAKALPQLMRGPLGRSGRSRA